MTSPDDVLRELGELATSLGPGIRPAGTEELLRSLAETARQLFGAAACSLAMLSAEYLTAQGDTEAAEQAIVEARGIAERLGCQPLLDRAAGIVAAPSQQRG